jgi:hypothetical protein
VAVEAERVSAEAERVKAVEGVSESPPSSPRFGDARIGAWMVVCLCASVSVSADSRSLLIH